MTETISFPRQLNGGPGFAQGGYLAGTMAELVGGPARTTFRAPTPIETPLNIERDGSSVRLVTSDGTIAVSAEPASVSIKVPPLPDRESILAARVNYRAHNDAPDNAKAPEHTCFVCSPYRVKPDGVELHPSPVIPGELVAALWVPEDQYAKIGVVTDRFTWAILDCPSGFGAMEAITEPYDLIFTGQMAAELLAPIRVGQEYIALGWPTGVNGRKISAASAICDLDGNVKAVSDSLWIATNPKP